MSLNAAGTFAKEQGRKYVAIARVDQDGHTFAFDKLPTGAKIDDEGCKRPCDDGTGGACGCADAGCPRSVKRRSDEEYLRRWDVYGIATSTSSASSVPPFTSAKA